MFGEFNETTQLKTALAKYSIDASASNRVFEAVRQTLHLTVCEKVCGQTMYVNGGIFATKCRHYSYSKILTLISNAWSSNLSTEN